MVSRRAAVYRGPALLELVAAGVIKDVKERGIKTTDIVRGQSFAICTTVTLVLRPGEEYML